MPKAKSDTITLPVEFGGVSIGKTTARLGLHVDRSALDLAAADTIFCGKRLTGRLILGNNGDAPGQGHLINDLDEVLDGVFDCKRIGANCTEITTGLTFALASIDIATLAKFSKGSGRLVVDEVEELPEDGDGEELPDEAPRSSKEKPVAKFDGKLADVPLSAVFGPKICALLVEASITTFAGLLEYQRKGRKLVDVKGIGPGKADNIEERISEWWKLNPELANEPEPVGAT